MKRYLWMAALAIGLTCISTSAFAGVENVTYTAGSGVMNVTITGTAEEPLEAVSLMVLKENITQEAYDRATDAQRVAMIEYAREEKTNSDGEWSFKLQLKGTEKNERLFRFRSKKNENITVLPVFGIDEALAAVNNASAQDIGKMLDKYAPFFEYRASDAYVNVFTSLDEEKKSYVYDAMAKHTDFDSTDEVDVAFEEYTAMSIIANAQAYDLLMEEIDICMDILGIDMSGYNILSAESQGKVCAGLIDAFENKVFTKSALESSFNTLVSNQTGSQNDSTTSGNRPSGGGGSSGGGGGYGGGSSVKETSFDAPADTSALIVSDGMFTDLMSVEWARESIESLAKLGIVNGKSEGIFAPNDTVTREEFVKMAVGVFGLVDNAAECDFNDVDKNEWYYRFVAAASRSGLVKGMGDGKFGVGEPITRQDIATILYNGMGDKLTSSAEDVFADEAKIADYAKTAVSALRGAGIINGVGENEFMPERSATRAEAAKMLYETMKVMK